MPGVRIGVLLWNQLELLYSLRKEIKGGTPGAPFCKNFIIHPTNFFKIKMM